MSESRVISLPERFDFAFHRQFSEQYQKALAEKTCKKITLDFTHVNYLDSSALGMMVLLHKKAKLQNVQTTIKGAKGTAAEILGIANVNQLFEIL